MSKKLVYDLKAGDLVLLHGEWVDRYVGLCIGCQPLRKGGVALLFVSDARIRRFHVLSPNVIFEVL